MDKRSGDDKSVPRSLRYACERAHTMELPSTVSQIMSVKAMEHKFNRLPHLQMACVERMTLSDNEGPYCIQGNVCHPFLLLEALHGEADAMEVVVFEVMGDTCCKGF